jgi:DNA adenine methylase
MRPICTMPGGKAFQGNMLVERFPRYSVYVEPFVGAGGVFFAKPKLGKEIISDKDPELIFVYRMLQRLPAPPNIQLDHISKETFEKYRKMRPTSDLERLKKFLVLQQASWRGNRVSYAPARAEAYSIKDSMFMKRWPEYHERLKGVTIYNKDWKEVVRPHLNNPDAFIYLDPPYETGGSSDVTMASRQGDWYGIINIDELANMLFKAKAKWMLSFSLNKELMKKMEKFRISTYTTRKEPTRK